MRQQWCLRRDLGQCAKRRSGAWSFNIKGDVARAGSVRARHTKFRHEHIEGCCFVPEGLLATAESREIYLFTEEHFRAAKQKE